MEVKTQSIHVRHEVINYADVVVVETRVRYENDQIHALRIITPYPAFASWPKSKWAQIIDDIKHQVGEGFFTRV